MDEPGLFVISKVRSALAPYKEVLFPVIQDGSIAGEAFIFQITALSDEHVSFSPQQGLMR